jgi:hypothetical protein
MANQLPSSFVGHDGIQDILQVLTSFCFGVFTVVPHWVASM